MATRNLNAPAIFAENAETVIPENPSGDVAYRDIALTEAEQKIGFMYNKVVQSSKLMNQYFYLLTSFLKEIETCGVLAWSENADYVSGAVVVASDNEIYIATVNNNNVNPLTDPAVWIKISDIAKQIYILQDLSNASKTGVGSTIATNNAPTLLNPTCTTQPAGTSNTSMASTEFVQNAVNNSGGSGTVYKYYLHRMYPSDFNGTIKPFTDISVSTLKIPNVPIISSSAGDLVDLDVSDADGVRVTSIIQNPYTPAGGNQGLTVVVEVRYD